MLKQTILAIDPGSHKCGLAVINGNAILDRAVVPVADLSGTIKTFQSKHLIDLVVIGSGTQSQKVKNDLENPELKLPTVFMPEKNTTLRARELYWKLNPPKGLWKLIPTSLRFPPVPVDDLAAVIIGREFLSSLK